MKPQARYQVLFSALKGRNYAERTEGEEAGEHTDTEMPNTQ